MAEFASDARMVVPFTPRRAIFHGRGGTLFGIYLRNILLTILTLGTYYFWGKNRTRSYLVGQSEFEGDRFTWHGTGRELFIGTLKVLLIVGPLAALAVAREFSTNQVLEVVAAVVIPLAYAFLVPLAAVGSRRYRMSRLSWRGIRFSFRGRVRDLFKIFLRGGLFSALTLGLYYPYFQTALRKFATEHSYFGTTRFTFDGQGRDLFGRYLMAIVAVVAAIGAVGYMVATRIFGLAPTLQLAVARQDVREILTLLLQLIVPVLGALAVAVVAWFWFLAHRHRYFWNHTAFGTARFRSTVTAGRLLFLAVSNFVLLVLTLGLVYPWVVTRSLNFYLSNIMLHGSLDLAGILQDAQAAGAASEGLADVLDVDFAGFDLPF